MGHTKAPNKTNSIVVLLPYILCAFGFKYIWLSVCTCGHPLMGRRTHIYSFKRTDSFVKSPWVNWALKA